jgi:hypothetical protein
MTKTIKVEYSDGGEEKIDSVENLYDLDWQSYREIERQVQAHAQMNRDGEIQALNIDKDDMGDFIVNMQQKLAEVILAQEDIKPSEVNVHTVKRIVRTYAEDMEKLGLKLKKNQGE